MGSFFLLPSSFFLLPSSLLSSTALFSSLLFSSLLFSSLLFSSLLFSCLLFLPLSPLLSSFSTLSLPTHCTLSFRCQPATESFVSLPLIPGFVNPQHSEPGKEYQLKPKSLRCGFHPGMICFVSYDHKICTVSSSSYRFSLDAH